MLRSLLSLTFASIVSAQTLAPTPSPTRLPPPPEVKPVTSENVTSVTTIAGQAPGSTVQDSASAAPTIDDLLDARAQAYTCDMTNLSTLFYAIGGAYHVNINVDPTITGQSQCHFNGGTLRNLINGILENNDLYMEQLDGQIYVRRLKEQTYYVDYPQIDRSFTSSNTVSLSPSTSNPSTTTVGGGVGGIPGIGGMNGQSTTSGQSSNGDVSTYSISEKSLDGQWASLKAELDARKLPFETVVLNAYAGRVIVTSTVHRLATWKTFFTNLNARNNAQVAVDITVNELQLNNDNTLGVNINQLQQALNKGGSTNISFSTNTSIASVGGTPLPANVLSANFATGKLATVVQALAEQGKMTLLTHASVRILNNQRTYIKVGDDKTFFSLSQNIGVGTGSLTGTTTTTTASTYTQQRTTIGFVTPITAQIGDDGQITLILDPSRTQLNGTDTSPDGTQTAPDINTFSLPTILRLKDNESTILGGLTQKGVNKQRNGVPYLENIPILGQLARTDASIATNNELLITVSAHIIK